MLHSAYEKGWSLQLLEQQIKLKGGDYAALFPEVSTQWDQVETLLCTQDIKVFIAVNSIALLLQQLFWTAADCMIL